MLRFNLEVAFKLWEEIERPKEEDDPLSKGRREIQPTNPLRRYPPRCHMLRFNQEVAT